MNKDKKLVLILIGPPGSGKGTQAGLLAEKFELFHLETVRVIEPIIMNAKKGDFLVVKGKKYDLLKEKKSWETGKLWSTALVLRILKDKIKILAKQEQNLIMTGSPRTVYEGEELISLLEKLYGRSNIKILLFELSVQQSIWRNSHRKICELMRHPILYTKETEKLNFCPLDGSRLVKRGVLDTPDVIKERFKVYEQQTFPLIEYFKKSGFKVIKINGEQSVSDVFSNILKHLEK